jgi:DNA-binding NarL/FixJ family response regulator
MIHLLLVDDQTLVRQGLRVLLEAQLDLQVVGEAENGRQAIEQVELLQPKIVLMDIHMPEMDGIAATQSICRRFSGTHILMLSTFDDSDYVARAMQFGAKGYLLKDTPAEELALAIRAVVRGHTQLGPGLFNKMMSSSGAVFKPLNLPPDLAALTPREQEVLRLIGTGANNREISEVLYISESTVKNHITRIFNRLHLRDRIQAALLANSFLPLD